MNTPSRVGRFYSNTFLLGSFLQSALGRPPSQTVPHDSPAASHATATSARVCSRRKRREKRNAVSLLAPAKTRRTRRKKHPKLTLMEEEIRRAARSPRRLCPNGSNLAFLVRAICLAPVSERARHDRAAALLPCSIYSPIMRNQRREQAERLEPHRPTREPPYGLSAAGRGALDSPPAPQHHQVHRSRSVSSRRLPRISVSVGFSSRVSSRQLDGRCEG